MPPVSKSILKEAFDRHADVLQKSTGVIMGDLEKAAQIVVDVFKSGGKILLCGNGGSAADSQHLAAEWVSKYKKDREPLPAIALTANSSIVTAVGNDHSFDHVFVRQVKALGNKGDALVVFTTSGRSKNVLNALDQAKAQGIHRIVFTGANGAHLRTVADAAIVVPSDETARIQEVHALAYHALCESVDEHFS